MPRPGDLYLQNRLALHGAFSNIGDTTRVSMQFGFYPRESVQDIVTKLPPLKSSAAGGAGKKEGLVLRCLC